MTYTYALMEVSQNVYREIADKLIEAGYSHAFHERGAIDMHGIAIVAADRTGEILRNNLELFTRRAKEARWRGQLEYAESCEAGALDAEKSLREFNKQQDG